MVIGLAVLSVSFAAFCVWLTVRMVNGRDRDLIGLAFITFAQIALWAGWITLGFLSH